MKARYSTNKRLESVAEKMYQEAMGCCEANFIIMLSVLHKYFNFGTNAEHTGRLDKVVQLWEEEAKKICEYTEEVDRHLADDYQRKLWNNMISSDRMKNTVYNLTAGFVPDEYRLMYLSDNITMREQERHFKKCKEEREKITMREANEVQAKMLAFRDAMKVLGG